MSSPARFLSAVDASQFIAGEPSSRLTTGFALAERLADVSAVIAAVLVADTMGRAFDPTSAASYSLSSVVIYASFLSLLFVLLLERHGGYRPCVSLLAIRETERILRVTLQSLAIAIAAAYFGLGHIFPISLGFVVVLVPLLVTVEKWEIRHLLRRLHSDGHSTRRAVILGTGHAARRIYTALIRSPWFGLEPVAFVEENSESATSEIFECAYRREHSAPILSGPVSPELFRRLDTSVLVIADGSPSRDSRPLQLSMASSAGVTPYYATGDFLEPGYWLDYAEVDGIMLARVSRGTNRVLYDGGKRVLDLAVACLALTFLAPLALLLALLVKLTSRGPAFFRQERVGKQGELFTMYKFRSMHVNAPQYGYSPTAEQDPRITALGRVMRRLSLDEIPQLINVFLGHMSLVGPRPEMPFIVEQYTPLQQQRLAVKPGITGLWQISADRKFLIHENLEYDLYYLKNNPRFVWNIALQLAGLKSFRVTTCNSGSEARAE
jgi:exopolysaccharide biosynthesis polyprenyl glycosylphosphotransferase